MANHHRELHLASPLLIILCLLLAPSSSAPAGPIKTVVILVMENRSFDHMLGWMKHLNPEIDGVTGAEYNRISTADPSSPPIFFGDQAVFVDPDPGHSFQAIREQIFGSNNSASPLTMAGFAQQAFSMSNSTEMAKAVMNGFDPDMVSVYKALISEFAVFDRWFASVPSSTQPPSFHPLRHLPRRHQQRREAACIRLPAAHHLRQSSRRGALVRHLLPEHPRYPVLPKFKKDQVHHKVPFFRVGVQRPLQTGEAAQLRGGGAEVHGLEVGSCKRRPPFPRRVPRANAGEGGVRGATGQPAVERDGARYHLRRARRLLRPCSDARSRSPQP